MTDGVAIEGVTRSYGGQGRIVHALGPLTATLRAGGTTAIVGPSGCGKTTCLRMVAGFYKPDGGILKFGERTINDVPPHKRNTGMVFHNYALWPHLNAAGNVEYGLKVRKIDAAQRKKRVQEALDVVRLGDLGARFPSQLSGGQQQSVALARALRSSTFSTAKLNRGRVMGFFR